METQPLSEVYSGFRSTDLWHDSNALMGKVSRAVLSRALYELRDFKRTRMNGFSPALLLIQVYTIAFRTLNAGKRNCAILGERGSTI
jgi:hypothetical protein